MCTDCCSTWILRNDLAGSSSGFFIRSWAQYTQEFGSPTSLYWIGLDRLHEVSQGNCAVRFDIQTVGGTWYFAQYSTFLVGDTSTNYQLTIGGYSDNGGDGMVLSNGQQFSTYDVDHDGWPQGSCASETGGGFWFGYCAYARITTSTSSKDFVWFYNSTAVMNLNAVQVRLIC